MQMKDNKKAMSFLLCMALTVAMALFTIGCNGKADSNPPSQTGANGQPNVSPQADPLQVGEGNTKFTFTVVDKEGNEVAFEVRTDKETVGEALLALGLIAGRDSVYGLYVETVNGLTVDYDKDGAYWAFYANGEYALTGVDATKIVEGASYSFKVE